MTMTEFYRHTQIGYAILVPLVIVLLVLFALGVINGFERHINLGLGAILIVAILFSALTVTVTQDAIRLYFGPGLIRKKIPLKDIESCRIVKNSWLYAWGIRITPHGLLYNVSGLSAVEIVMKDGKKYRIGTDVPEELERAIKQLIG